MKAKFEKLLLIPTAGQPFDITDLVVEVNVFQDLFSHYMTCEIVMKDSISISRGIPSNEEDNLNGGLTGGELLLMQYYSENNPIIVNCFSMYERKARTKESDSTEVYILSGISLEAFESFTRKISRAYGGSQGNEISKMVDSVTREYLYTRTVRDVYSSILKDFKTLIEKTIVVEETSGKHRFIIPNLSVDDTLEFFSNEADSKDHIPQYLFYENYYGFNFWNLSTLVESTPVMEYYYTEFNTNEADRDQRKIISYNVKKENNILESAKAGLFASKTIRLDVLKKTKSVKVFDYQKLFDKFKKLQPYKQKGSANPDVNVTLMTTRQGHDCSCQIFKDENHLPKRIDGIIGSRRSYTEHIMHNILSVVVPGTTALNVGDTVLLKFPIKDGLFDSKDTKLDKELSGKYIITKLRNKFTNVGAESRFVTVFECVKDTQIQES